MSSVNGIPPPLDMSAGVGGPHTPDSSVPSTPRLASSSPTHGMFTSRMPAVPALPEQVRLLKQTRLVCELHTVIRDRNTTRSDFIFNTDRLTRLLVEEGLNSIEIEELTVMTPSGEAYEGVGFAESGKLCGVSIMRSGECMERSLRDCCRSIRIGKMLVQRDPNSNKPTLLYAKFPPDIHERQVLLVDPVLASGKTAAKAVQVLVEKAGVPEEKIFFLTLIASTEGIQYLVGKFPQLTIVTTAVDQDGLDEHGLIKPGLGSFGGRYFGTDDNEV